MRSFMIFAALAALAGCGGGGNSNSAPRVFFVTYVVEGAAGDNSQVAITYENPTGGTSQVTANMPWTFSFNQTEGQFVYVSAQRRASAAGSVTTTIRANNNVFRTSTSSGQFVIATASGTCC